MNKQKKNTQVGKINYSVILIYFFLTAFIFPVLAEENIDGNFIEIRILHKVSSKSNLLKLKIGEEKKYKNLLIKSLKCKNSKFDDNPEVTAYIQVQDLTNTDKNPKWEKHAEAGVQLIYMDFSNRDGELISYIKNWDLANKAIIRKPKYLRFFPIPIKTPKPQKKSNDFGPRKCKPGNAFMQCI